MRIYWCFDLLIRQKCYYCAKLEYMYFGSDPYCPLLKKKKKNIEHETTVGR